MRRTRRVVITGLGVVAPNGIGKDAFWQNLIAGKSAVDWITAFDPTPFPCRIAAEVRNFNPTDFISLRHAKLMGRFSQFAVAAARLAFEDSRLNVTPETAPRIGVCFGTSAQGGGDINERLHEEVAVGGPEAVTASTMLDFTAHAMTAHILSQLNISGQSSSVSSACCTSLDAVNWGLTRIRSGELAAAIVGASEAPLFATTYAGLCAGGFFTKWEGPPRQASRPYDKLRSGFVLGEGSGAVILEDMDDAVDRGATIYAEVLGMGGSAEINQHGLRDMYKTALIRAILQTLKAAGMSPSELDHINAHGNSTVHDDQSETNAYKELFGPRAYSIPISSIKSMIGQALAAAGMFQVISTCLTIRHRIIPPTINLEYQDPSCDLDYTPNKARTARVRRALLHSHSMGGTIPGTHTAAVLAAPVG